MSGGGAIPQPLFVRSFGQGPRRALALHCTIAHSGAWRGLAAQMDSELTLVTPDMLSHGRSPDWDRQGDFPDRMFEAVEPLLEPGMDVIGHSFGATVALRLAASFPERVRSLTLLEPVMFCVAIADAPGTIASHDAEIRPVFEALDAGDDALGARLFNRMWGDTGGPRWDQMPEQMRAAMVRGIHVLPASVSATNEDRPGILRPGVLDRLTMPVAILRGGASHPSMVPICDGLAARIAGARNIVVDGAGHMLPVTRPEDAAAHLRALLAASPG
ncbi:alpha/beta fold hydrolase [Pukyongiella litopenaei]|uniref:Alpha/beta hydrolase n=1 Tax=Pukyongiella litopenaei TaxID=2605946 RepID=A0A2S0MLW1_9RHOB|nr:alpha/beta hydrolase [Pukyongiella litopenaei]AVO36870.1 alpha/beta hydrolase [Pukyongiella litopenaei]